MANLRRLCACADFLYIKKPCVGAHGGGIIQNFIACYKLYLNIVYSLLRDCTIGDYFMKEVIVFMKTEAVNEPKLYGYARVSTFQQKEDRQIIALKSIGVLDKNIYVDKQTGKDFNRPQYKKLLRKLDASSVLVIKSLDRLGRNYHELSEQWRIITKEKRSDIVVIDVPLLDTRREKNLLGTLISDLILSLLSYCSDNEYRIIHQRQAEGIAAAKAKGIKFGRPPKPLPENFHVIVTLWSKKLISTKKAAELCGMPTSSFRYKAKNYKI